MLFSTMGNFQTELTSLDPFFNRAATRRAFQFAVTLLLATVLDAQTQQGDILGTVRDPQAAGVPGAEVKITNVRTGAMRTATSDERGDYLAPGFFPGVYRLEVSMAGFQKSLIDGIRVEPQSKIRVDVSLIVGEVATEVNVSAPLIKAEGSTVDITLPQIFVEKKAVNPSRDGWALEQAMWFPGSSGGGVGWGSWGGVPLPHMEYQADGAQQDRELFLPPQSIQQVSLIMGTPSAEYGRPVTTNVVFRSGTNQLHGEYSPNLVNPRTNAVNTPQSPGVRPVGLNQWRHEFNLSGPVYIPKLYDGRNKTFFFFDLYNTPPIVVGGARIVSIPSARMFTGDYSRYRDRNGNLIQVKDPTTGQPFLGNVIPANRISPIARAVIQDVLVDNFNGFGKLTRIGAEDSFFQNGLYPFREERTNRTWIAKFDQNIGSRHVLSGSWNHYTNSIFKDGNNMPGLSRYSETPQRRFNVGHTWVVTPKIVNQLRVAFAKVAPAEYTARSFSDRSRLPGGEIVKRWGVPGITDNGLAGAPKFAISDGVEAFLDHNTHENG
ncbi:MAG: carboxypeptidase regulatory-like domain-containing protein, partial [Acidobacteria bacterium]|nr:carboxypeptidase regulatory-like domain-containing protein [Acidobacteriota bacterium]